MNDDEPTVRLDDVTVTYGRGAGQVHALRGASAEFRRGEMACIVGPSGSGKSTLLSVLATLRRPDSGAVWLGERRVENLAPADAAALRRRHIGLVFQGFRLLRHLTVLENLRVAQEVIGVAREEQLELALAALDRVGLRGKERRRLDQLSGGEKQRVAIARATLTTPELLLADEPTASLDIRSGMRCVDLLAELATRCAVVLVTHDPRVAERSDALWSLADGVLTRVHDRRH